MTNHPNGRDQTNLYARLVKPLNTDQQAPAESAWKPDNVAGFKVGDYCRLPQIDTPLLIVGLADPVLILESPSGHQLRAGWRSVTKIRTHQEIQKP